MKRVALYIMIMNFLLLCFCGCTFSDSKNQTMSADNDLEESETHTHTLIEWQSDGKYHWQECTVCHKKVNYGMCFNGGYDPNWSKPICEVCSNEYESVLQNTYTIHYDVANANATIESLTQTVKYGEEFKSLVPQIVNDEFTGWKVVGTDEPFWSGVYLYKSDIYVYATWLSGSYSKIVR